MYVYVEGFADPEQSKEFEQDEEIEQLSQEVKREDVEIKEEPGQENDEDYNTMLSMEYLETVQEDVVYPDEYEQNEEEFSFINQTPKGLKKQYKRFVLHNCSLNDYILIFNFRLYRALCTHCGNSYYKDQLQRHIDVSFNDF